MSFRSYIVIYNQLSLLLTCCAELKDVLGHCENDSVDWLFAEVSKRSGVVAICV